MKNEKPSAELVDKFYRQLREDAGRSGYRLNPDEPFAKELVEALIINTERYGYPSCPCRLAEGIREDDLDIICPCDYRDPDLTEFGNCYCALYVSEEIASGNKEVKQIPERRPNKEEREKLKVGSGKGDEPDAGTRGQRDAEKELAYPVWRCRVCGYLCARDEPPGSCPICGAQKDRFERFM